MLSDDKRRTLIKLDLSGSRAKIQEKNGIGRRHYSNTEAFWCCYKSNIFTNMSCTCLWPFSKSKFNLKPDRVNLVAPASSIECLLYLPSVRAIQYKLGPERLPRLGNSNVLRLPLIKALFKWNGSIYIVQLLCLIFIELV